jgi:protein-S-isoprenylcysteine O-methyltransferase Ste14
MKLKSLIGLFLLAVIVSLLVFWFALNRISLIFSIAAQGYPQNWGFVILNLILLCLFILFIPFRKKIAYLPSSIYLAFIVALYVEMYGFPLTMYILSWVFGFENPGNLWYLIVTVIGQDLFVSLFLGIILPISNMIILIGILLVIFGWRRVFRSKDRLVTTGIYQYVRHPQYLGFLLITLGINVLWITFSTLILYPFLIILYYRLAQKEEKELEDQFGEAYIKYKHRVPMFIPRLKPIEISD